MRWGMGRLRSVGLWRYHPRGHVTGSCTSGAEGRAHGPYHAATTAGHHHCLFRARPARTTAVRLHPRVGTPGPTASSLGGPCCGPAGEFWPTCQEPHHGGVERILAPPEISALDQAEQWALATPGLSGIGREDDGAIFGTRERYNPPQVPTPMIGVPQLSANDVPDLPFPLQTDLFQLLWCPNDHDEPW
jgi:hypothetical protein